MLLDGLPDSGGEWVRVGMPCVGPKHECVAPRMAWRGHNTPRAPGGDNGAFWATQVLEAGQRFRTRVECTNPRSVQLLEHLMEEVAGRGSLYLKGSRGAQQPVEITASASSWDEDHLNPGDEVHVDGNGSLVWLTLLSPALVWDQWGRTGSVLSGDWLTAQLGIEAVRARLLRHYSAHEPAMGESGAWGLPLAPESAIATGSAFLYELQGVGEQDAEKVRGALRRLFREGIGGRRPEGFGQVMLNWDFHLKRRLEGGDQ